VNPAVRTPGVHTRREWAPGRRASRQLDGVWPVGGSLGSVTRITWYSHPPRTEPPSPGPNRCAMGWPESAEVDVLAFLDSALAGIASLAQLQAKAETRPSTETSAPRCFSPTRRRVAEGAAVDLDDLVLGILVLQHLLQCGGDVVGLGGVRVTVGQSPGGGGDDLVIGRERFRFWFRSGRRAHCRYWPPRSRPPRAAPSRRVAEACWRPKPATRRSSGRRSRSSVPPTRSSELARN
jgi:hypothetical protein